MHSSVMFCERQFDDGVQQQAIRVDLKNVLAVITAKCRVIEPAVYVNSRRSWHPHSLLPLRQDARQRRSLECSNLWECSANSLIAHRHQRQLLTWHQRLLPTYLRTSRTA